MLTIAGQVVAGYGVASGTAQDSPYPDGTIAMQIPHFTRRGLDLSRFYPGTLNVQFDVPSCTIVQADITLRGVTWTANVAPEDFSFVHCTLVFRSRQHPALVYYPHPETKTQHFQQPNMLEFLAPKINEICYGDSVELIYNQNKLKL